MTGQIVVQLVYMKFMTTGDCGASRDRSATGLPSESRNTTSGTWYVCVLTCNLRSGRCAMMRMLVDFRSACRRCR